MALCAEVGAVWPCRGATAGENQQKPEEPPKIKPREVPKTNAYQLKQLSTQVARFSTVAVVEVVEAGEMKDDEKRPELPLENRFAFQFRQTGPKVQRVRCKVVQMLRGPAGAKEIEVLFRHPDIRDAQRRLMAARRRNAGLEEMEKLAAVTAGEKYLVVLAVDPNAGPRDGGKGEVYSTLSTPLFGPPPEAVKAVREMVARIRRYQRPAKPTEKQLAAAAAHIKELESAEFGKRRQAHEALVKLGPEVRDLLERSGRESPDLEVRLRCEKVLDDIKPIPGGQPQDWAGSYVIKKVEAAEEKDEKDGEGDQDGEKRAAPAPAPAIRPAGAG
jgi:hypothetical protein